MNSTITKLNPENIQEASYPKEYVCIVINSLLDEINMLKAEIEDMKSMHVINLDAEYTRGRLDMDRERTFRANEYLKTLGI